MKISSQQFIRRSKRSLSWRGFTLVELLLVISIIAILSTLSLAMIRTSQEEARTSATEARISQIETILSTYIEDMEFRKLPFRQAQFEDCVIAPNASQKYVMAQQLRERVLVDYLMSELPFQHDQVGTFPRLDYSSYSGANALIAGRPTALIQQWQSLAGSSLGKDGSTTDSLSGELLYKLIEMIDFEGESALDAIGNGAVDDTDSDNFPELVDAWGDPLRFDVVKRNSQNGSSVPLNAPESEAATEIQNVRLRVWSKNITGLEIPARVEL